MAQVGMPFAQQKCTNNARAATHSSVLLFDKIVSAGNSVTSATTDKIFAKSSVFILVYD